MTNIIFTRRGGAPAVSGSSGGGGGSESYITVDDEGGLSGARQLVAGQGIQFIDNGPGGTFVAQLNMQFNEVPTGSADGVNDTFTLGFSPTPSTSLMLHRNGLMLMQGIDCDYTLSGSTITFATAPRSGSNILATYVKP